MTMTPMTPMTTNFLEKFKSLFEGTEVPELFSIWSGISCLSAMLERRIWVDMNLYTIYPNTYIIFVADSGRMRKGTAIKLTKKLLSKTDPGPRIVAQKITPEALIDSLKVIQVERGLGGPGSKNLLKETCGGIAIAEELMTLLNRDTYERGLGSLMIELWDCPDKYEYRTRNRPPEEIHYGHLSLLGATTVHALREVVPIQAMGDGFSSRVLFVYVDKPAPPVPRPVTLPGFKKIEEELVLHLQKLSSLQGEVKFTSEAEQFFDDEYRRFYNSPLYSDAQFQAYASRRDKHLLKVAMCLMAAEDQSMVLTPQHLEGARVLLQILESNMRPVFDRIAMTESGSLTDEVYKSIASAKARTMTRADVLQKFGNRMSAQDLAKIIETLVLAGRIRMDTSAGKVIYKLGE